MAFRFEQLDIWKESNLYVSKIYKITRSFPSEEKFGLTKEAIIKAVTQVLKMKGK